jgi:hypothetical protein
VTRNLKLVLNAALAAVPVAIAAAYFMAAPFRVRNPEGRTETAAIASTAASAPPAPAPSTAAGDHPNGRTLGQQTRDSASQRFSVSRKCASHQVEIANLQSMDRACEQYSSHPDVPHYKECHAETRINVDLIAELKADSQGCPPGQDATVAYFNDTVEAAKAGDSDAQLCYIESKFWVDGRAMRYSDEERADYQHDAPIYIQRALERGDWRVAALLSSKRVSGMANVTAGDPYFQYKLNRLLRQGANGQYAEILDRDAQIDYLSPGLSQAPKLSQDQIAQANAEAKEIFDRSFKDKPRITEAPAVCSPPSAKP